MSALILPALCCGPATVCLAQTGPPTATVPSSTPPVTTPPTPDTPPTTPPEPRPAPPAPIHAYPLPLTNPYRWRFTLAAPSPALFQSRDENRPRRIELQFPFAVFGGLGQKKGWGHFFLASENVISTDAYDSSARLGLRLGVEHPLFPPGPLLTSEIGIVTNQRGQNQALGASVGTRFYVPIPLGTGAPDLQINFLGYENRRRLNYEDSPQHTGRDVMVSSARLTLPPLCFGKRDPNMRPHLLFRSRAWFFFNEKALPGFTPRDFEQRMETALVIPARTVRRRSPFVRSVAISYIIGANDANAYAQQRNFRVNFILVDTRQLLDELTEHGVIPKVPGMKYPNARKPEDKQDDGSPDTPAGAVKSSTKPENTGKSPKFGDSYRGAFR